MKILIVDDNPLTATVMAGVLRSYNFDVIVAYRGLQGLEYLAENPQVQLIVVDIMMPEMTGFEFISNLREEPSWRDTPVVVCTALSDPETVRKISSLGCRSYVLKPVTEDELILKVRQALDTKALVLEHQDVAMERVGMDLETYEQTVRTFAIMLDAKARTLEGLLRADVEDVSLDLGEVFEGAKLLGARRLSGLLDRFATLSHPNMPGPIRADWALLLQEVKSLRRALAPSSTFKFTI